MPDEQVNVIREDPRNADTLYIGTDQGGVYVSKTGGTAWISLSANLPPAAVHDIAIHARERELVIGTHGRSVFKVDLVPVQDFSDAIAAEPLARAYETLILDALLGDASLFTRADEVEEAWSIVDPIVDSWADEPPPVFPNYDAGTWGPAAADELLTREGRRWRRI